MSGNVNFGPDTNIVYTDNLNPSVTNITINNTEIVLVNSTGETNITGGSITTPSITDTTSSTGTANQVLTAGPNGGSLVWADNSGGGITTYITDTTSSTGTANQVLTAGPNGNSLVWADNSGGGSTPSLADVLNTSNDGSQLQITNLSQLKLNSDTAEAINNPSGVEYIVNNGETSYFTTISRTDVNTGYRTASVSSVIWDTSYLISGRYDVNTPSNNKSVILGVQNSGQLGSGPCIYAATDLNQSLLPLRTGNVLEIQGADTTVASLSAIGGNLSIGSTIDTTSGRSFQNMYLPIYSAANATTYYLPLFL